jgi:hypothetical protein
VVKGLFHVLCNPDTPDLPKQFPVAQLGIINGVLSIDPQPKNMRRLAEVSERPWMAVFIKEVVIYVADFDGNKLLDNLPGQTDDENMPRRQADLEKSQAENLVEKMNTDYCDREKLVRAFSQLPMSSLYESSPWNSRCQNPCAGSGILFIYLIRT